MNNSIAPLPTVIKVATALSEWLKIENFKDYSPNGLQIAPYPTNRPLQKLAGAVTASQKNINAAIKWNADALLVHHGFFWDNEPRALLGTSYLRIQALMVSGMALIGYHLPLDAHPVWGNNAQLADIWGVQIEGYFGDKQLGCIGSSTNPDINTLANWRWHIEKTLGRKPLVIGEDTKIINKISWCSGGAQSYFRQAVDIGADLFITGESSEFCYHLANETGVAFMAAGHHATERFGVMALGAEAAKQFSCDFKFFDEPNPI